MQDYALRYSLSILSFIIIFSFCDLFCFSMCIITFFFFSFLFFWFCYRVQMVVLSDFLLLLFLLLLLQSFLFVFSCISNSTPLIIFEEEPRPGATESVCHHPDVFCACGGISFSSWTCDIPFLSSGVKSKSGGSGLPPGSLVFCVYLFIVKLFKILK